jgi:hypothetical protein
MRISRTDVLIGVLYVILLGGSVITLRAIAPAISGDLLKSLRVDFPGWADSVRSLLGNVHIIAIWLLGAGSALVATKSIRKGGLIKQVAFAMVGSAVAIAPYLVVVHRAIDWHSGGSEILILWGIVVVAWAPASIFLASLLSGEGNQNTRQRVVGQ